jgi:SAM-dependent methyltransferase
MIDGMTSRVPAILSESLAGGTCLLLVLSQPHGESQDPLVKVDVRPIALRKGNCYQFTLHRRDRVTHENLEPRAAAARAERLLTESFEQAALFTPTADYSLHTRRDGTFSVRTSPPTKPTTDTAHNRRKTYLIPEGVPCPFLAEIGVMTPDGQVRRAMHHKFRQINRFVELVNDIVDALPAGRELRVVGCGKSYLTFALHHLLTAIHRLPVKIVGLDRKADVVRQCAAISRKLGCTGLEFREGDIASHVAEEPVDLAVSLHACDTATDDALAQAVRWNAGVILAVPCCQHELAPQLCSEPLQPLLRHGILRDRFAALATDSLRALLLESHGYAVQIVEFIDLEHTPKNLLIRGVRHSSGEGAFRASRRAEYETLKSALGLKHFRLEQSLQGSQASAWTSWTS